VTASGTRIGFEDAIAEALRLEMHRDPALVVFSTSGEGVAGQLSSTFGPERVIETHAVGAPIVLAACGAAEEGLRPVCELGAAEAGPTALDQIAELAAIHAANLDVASPLTVRLSWGDPLTAGGAAAVDPLARLIGAEGIKLVAPATAADAKGLTVAAVRDPDPVCVLEHAALRRVVDPVPEGTHMVEIGRARLAREGSELTLVTHGVGVPLLEEIAEELELDADLIDLRTLQPLDSDAVLTSVRKTGRVLFVEPDAAAHRITAELVAAVWEEAFEYLDAPPRRIRLGPRATNVAALNGDGSHDQDIETIERATDELLEY
jgi:pyruvate/2-oxoglutarate/acetoin dehydrogenase E1 component